MSIKVVHTDFAGNAVTEQQLNLLTQYQKSFFDNEELKKVEFWSFNYIQNKPTPLGGLYYLTQNEDLSFVKSELNGKDWTLYYNRSDNDTGDTIWDYQVLHDNLVESHGKVAFDSQLREIADSVFSDDTNSYISNTKHFFGDPDVFPPPYKGAATFTFYYDNFGNPVEVVSQYGDRTDFDYSITEFLSDTAIISSFPWDQHPYFHTFEPMLP